MHSVVLVVVHDIDVVCIYLVDVFHTIDMHDAIGS